MPEETQKTKTKQSIFMLHILELPLNSINYRFVHNIQFNICVKARFIFFFFYLYYILYFNSTCIGKYLSTHRPWLQFFLVFFLLFKLKVKRKITILSVHTFMKFQPEGTDW